MARGMQKIQAQQKVHGRRIPTRAHHAPRHAERFRSQPQPDSRAKRQNFASFWGVVLGSFVGVPSGGRIPIYRYRIVASIAIPGLGAAAHSRTKRGRRLHHRILRPSRTRRAPGPPHHPSRSLHFGSHCWRYVLAARWALSQQRRPNAWSPGPVPGRGAARSIWWRCAVASLAPAVTMGMGPWACCAWACCDVCGSCIWPPQIATLTRCVLRTSVVPHGDPGRGQEEEWGGHPEGDGRQGDEVCVSSSRTPLAFALCRLQWARGGRGFQWGCLVRGIWRTVALLAPLFCSCTLIPRPLEHRSVNATQATAEGEGGRKWGGSKRTSARSFAKDRLHREGV